MMMVSVPVSTRDLAMLVPDGVPAADVLAVVREAGRPLVREARVFDRYAVVLPPTTPLTMGGRPAM